MRVRANKKITETHMNMQGTENRQRQEKVDRGKTGGDIKITQEPRLEIKVMKAGCY